MAIFLKKQEGDDFFCPKTAKMGKLDYNFPYYVTKVGGDYYIKVHACVFVSESSLFLIDSFVHVCVQNGGLSLVFHISSSPP